MRGLEHLARGLRIGRAAFRRETVHRLDKAPELPALLLGFAFFLSRQRLAGVLRAALDAPGNRGGAAPPELRGAGPVALRVIEGGQIVHACERIGMLLAQHPLAGRQRALIERLGLAIAALGVIEEAQIVHACKRIGMLRAQHALAGRQRALIERLGLAIAALGLIEPARLFTLVSVSGCSRPSTRS